MLRGASLLWDVMGLRPPVQGTKHIKVPSLLSPCIRLMGRFGFLFLLLFFQFEKHAGPTFNARLGMLAPYPIPLWSGKGFDYLSERENRSLYDLVSYLDTTCTLSMFILLL